jgi:fermentation-respiration switch protein FrsA (DUF1100 family)
MFCLLLFLKNHFIFYPSKDLTASPASLGWEFYDLFLEGPDGIKINAWYLPPLDERMPTVLLFHGNGGNLSEMLGRIMAYYNLGFGVLAMDYHGYGLSQGKPSEEALYLDAVTSWDFLTKTRGVAPENIIFHGFSLGGGVASYMAVKYKEYHNPLILDSTFSSLKDVARTQGLILSTVGPLVLGDAFDTNKRLKEMSPSILLVFHSPQDEIVSFALGEKNFNDYQGGPKEFVRLKGGHMDFFDNQSTYILALQTYLLPKELSLPTEADNLRNLPLNPA